MRLLEDEKVIIINDVHGQYNTLIKLIEKIPKDKKDKDGGIILAGDICDRGPDSRKVIELVMAQSNIRVIMGDHEDMLVDFLKETHRYDHGLYEYNGGIATMNSYGITDENDIGNFPKEHLGWIEKLPLYIEGEDFIITHAPINPVFGLEKCCDIKNMGESSIIWNRGNPGKRTTKKFQIFGHNSHWGLRRFGDYAICIDTSQSAMLTAYDTKTKQIYQEKYV